MRRRVIGFLLVLLVASPLSSRGAPATVSSKKLPEGTRVYAELQERVSGKRGQAEVGQLVNCKVWRDVVVDGKTLIEAGRPIIAKVDKIKHANIVGIKGKMSLAAYETTAVDGQAVQLTGGYMKEGKSRMALSISLAVFVWPLIFIPGKAAELPEGMVFDVFTGPDQVISADVPDAALPTIDLSNSAKSFSAEVLLDELVKEKKPKVFKMRIDVEGEAPPAFIIDNVNGKAIVGIPLVIRSSETVEDGLRIVAEVEINELAKHFRRGINRYEVAYNADGQRVGAEVILNIQM